jgi:hypothetical protein
MKRRNGMGLTKVTTKISHFSKTQTLKRLAAKPLKFAQAESVSVRDILKDVIIWEKDVILSFLGINLQAVFPRPFRAEWLAASWVLGLKPPGFIPLPFQGRRAASISLAWYVWG